MPPAEPAAAPPSGTGTPHAPDQQPPQWLHRVGHPPHDPGGQRARRDQPVPGLPGLRSARRRCCGPPSAAAREGPHQYAVTWGAAELPRRPGQEAVAGSWACRSIPDAHFVVTCGSTEAMMVAMMTACDPGRQGHRVLALLRELRGRRHPLRRRAHLRRPAPPGLRLRPGGAEPRLRSSKPKALILCNPSNPSGKVFTREELVLHRRPGRGARHLRHHRRGLRAHRVRAPPRTPTSRPCRGCSSAPSPAAPSPRPTPSPAGAWAT